MRTLVFISMCYWAFSLKAQLPYTEAKLLKHTFTKSCANNSLCEFLIQKDKHQIPISQNRHQGYFTLSGPEDFKRQVFDSNNNLGQKVLSGRVNEGNRFYLSGLSDGCYSPQVDNNYCNIIQNN